MKYKATMNKRFFELGFKNDEELLDFLFDNELKDEAKENGYDLISVLIEEEKEEDSGIPQILRISKYKDKYIFWYTHSECIHDSGFFWSPSETDDFFVFNSLDEARKHRDEYPKGDEPLKVQYKKCMEAVGEDLEFEVVNDAYCHHFNIYYKNSLLIEYLLSLNCIDDIEYIKEKMNKYHEIENALKKINARIWRVVKKREWNSNIRYYIYTIDSRNQEKTYEVPIPSKYQHKRRSTLDFFPYDKILNDFEKQIVYQD